MSEQEFDSYLRLLARFLNLSGNQRTAIARELRAHMEDRLDDLLARGYTREEAIQTALDEFGDAAALAGEFGKIGRRRRWIMRTTTTTFAVAAAVLLVSFLLPQHTAWVPSPAMTHAGEKAIEPPASGFAAGLAEAALYKEPEADRAAREKLTTIVATVDLAEGTTLADAVDFLRLQGALTLNVNWAALAPINIERTTDIGGLNLKDVKISTVLNIVLDNVTQASGGVGRAAYEVVDGVIRISSQEDLNSRTLVRAYDCSDLIGQPLTAGQKDALAVFAGQVRAARAPARSTRTNERHGAAPGDQVATSRPAAKPDATPDEPLVAEVLAALRNRDVEDFIALVTSMVEPESWAPEGDIGAVSIYDGLLVVRHTNSTQRQVADLLSILRQAKASRQARGGAAAVER